MRISTLWVIAALMAVTVPPAAATLINGGAEEGIWGSADGNETTALTGWTFEGISWNRLYSDFYIGPIGFAFVKHSGDFGAATYHLSAGTEGAETLCQWTQTATDLVPGGLYDVSAWIKSCRAGGVGNGEGKLGAKNSDDSEYTWGPMHGTTDYTQYTVQVTASAAGTIDVCIYLDLGDYNWGGGSARKTPQVAWDDVTITEAVIPEPGSVIALLSGLVGMGVLVRRRK